MPPFGTFRERVLSPVVRNVPGTGTNEAAYPYVGYPCVRSVRPYRATAAFIEIQCAYTVMVRAYTVMVRLHFNGALPAIKRR